MVAFINFLEGSDGVVNVMGNDIFEAFLAHFPAKVVAGENAAYGSRYCLDIACVEQISVHLITDQLNERSRIY